LYLRGLEKAILPLHVQILRYFKKKIEKMGVTAKFK